VDQSSSDAATGLLAGGIFFVVYMVFILIFLAFGIWLFWRIFTKAGMSGAMSLLLLVPGFGFLIVLCILAFGTWKVVPAPQVATYGGPSFPPQGYPPQQNLQQGYPPQGNPPPPGNYPPRY
jgi:thiol:disulfide interchange protein